MFIAENVINAVRHAVKLDSRGNNEGAKEEKRQSPCVITGSLGKDKKDQNVQVEIESSVWHKPTLVTTAGVDIQNGGGNGGIIYTGRAETRLKSNRHFKTAIGGSLSTFQVHLGSVYYKLNRFGPCRFYHRSINQVHDISSQVITSVLRVFYYRAHTRRA